MRPQPDLPPRPPRRERRAKRRLAGRGRLVLGVLLGLLLVLLISLRGIAGFYTDYLWFHSIGRSGLWGQMLTTKALLGLAGGLIFFVLCWSNLLIAERLAPVFRPSSGEDDLIERYQELIGNRTWIVRLATSLLLALMVGVGLGAAWNEWILFTNRVDFGQKDATFHTDIGFYVFELPFLSAAATWLFSSLVVIFVVTLLAHVVNGGIRFHTQLDRVTPQVKAHISVMLGVLALVQAGRYWLSRYELTFSTRGAVDGATYTDVNVEQRAIYLLMMISLFAFALFIANIWRRGWVLPGMAVGLWVLVYVIAGSVVPAFVQRVRVEPTESTRERPYIVNNIEATRQAYGLEDVSVTQYDWTEALDAAALDQSMGTMGNVRLWDPGTMQASFAKKQAMRGYYDIGDVDVDRYLVDGEQTEVMIAARELNENGIKNPSWEASHLVYTNGWGVVAAEADAKTSSGDPKLLAEDIPVKVSGGLPEIKEPRIYFGEDQSGYVIVNTDVQDPTSESADQVAAVTTYTGADGIEIGSGANGFLRKAAFALRFGQLDPMVSGSITPDSKVLLERDVTDRVEALAPYLAFDHDPYMVLVDGRLQYVVDGYTTTRNFPNAQRADTGGLDEGSGLYGRSFNYARNSVKAVVDAYDGTITLYVVDENDPIIQAYQKAFPDLYTPVDEADPDLREHFRYPEDLFTVQTQMWATYHVDDPTALLNGRDDWAVPQDTGASEKKGGETKALGPDGQELTGDDRYASQYLLMQLPGEEEASFVLLRPYVPASDDDEGGGKDQLRAFIVADSDPENYGTLRTYTLDPTNLPDGPNLAADDMQSDDDVGSAIKSLCTDKATCTFTAPSILPVGNSLLYVQSFLVAGKQNAPRIEYVIVNYRHDGESQVAIDTSLRAALVQIFGDGVPAEIEDAQPTTSTDPGSQPSEEQPPSGSEGEPLTSEESALLEQLIAAFDAADQAGRDGKPVEREEHLAEAQRLAEELSKLRDDDGASTDEPPKDGTTTTTEPSTTTTSPEITTTTTAGA